MKPQHFFAEKYETRMLILKIAITISDVKHCFLEWEDNMSWCEQLEAEFFDKATRSAARH